MTCLIARLYLIPIYGEQDVTCIVGFKQKVWSRGI